MADVAGTRLIRRDPDTDKAAIDRLCAEGMASR
jgi:hypothetical protein